MSAHPHKPALAKQPVRPAFRREVTRESLEMLGAVLKGQVSHSGSLRIRRKVSDETAAQLNEIAAGITSYVPNQRRIKRFSVNPGVSLITPREGRTITSHWLHRFADLEMCLHAAADKLPKRHGGFIGKAIITGMADPKRSGDRYIGYRLDTRLHGIIAEESEQMATTCDWEHEPDRIPHITLYKTEEPYLAESLRRDLDKERDRRNKRHEQVMVKLGAVSIDMPQEYQ